MGGSRVEAPSGDDSVRDERALTRAERRERTHAAILEAARQTFAENGYQKATIRAVAQRAGCDPALVMQHFGNKVALFRAATTIDVDVTEAFAKFDGRSEQVLLHTFERLDAQPEAIASTLRSMLTHDDIADEALQLFNPPRIQRDPTTGQDRDTRDELRRRHIAALILGTAIQRYVLKAPEVQNATLSDLVASLRPALDALDPPPVAG
jgi:AcrR family transcriptional regulator